MGAWDAIFDDLLYAADLQTLESYSSAPFEQSESYSRAAASKPAFSQAFKDFFLSLAKDTSLSDMLQAFVENDCWHVNLLDDGSHSFINATAGQFRLALEALPAEKAIPSKKKAAKQSKHLRQGKGGKLLAVYQEKPEGASVVMDGRALVRSLQKDWAGILVHPAEGEPFEILGTHFELLNDLADEYDLEEMLVSPGPDQLDKLKHARWWVESSGDEVEADDYLGNGLLVHVYTRPDRIGMGRPRVPMFGAQLFRKVSRLEECDGVAINVTSMTGCGDRKINGMVLPPAFTHNLFKGRDIRPGAGPLPARNIKEIELWLQLRRFPSRDRRLLEAPVAGEILVRAMVPAGSTWLVAETIANQFEREGPTWSPVFSLPPANNKDGLSERPSEILCPGLLAKELNAGAFVNGKRGDKYWSVGRSFLIGRCTDAQDRRQSIERLEMARELLKLVPAGQDSIPRDRFLTVEGAAFLSEHPHGASRKWIEDTVKRAETFTRPWVWAWA